MKEETTAKDIKRNVKRCFKYVQGELKALYRESLKQGTANSENLKDIKNSFTSPRAKNETPVKHT
jgi:hypothetical protein